MEPATRRRPGETRDEHFERWKREQPARLYAHRAKRVGRSRPVRALLQAKDFAVGLIALAFVAAAALGLVLLVFWLMAALVGDAWPYLAGAVAVLVSGSAWAKARGR